MQKIGDGNGGLISPFKMVHSRQEKPGKTFRLQKVVCNLFWMQNTKKSIMINLMTTIRNYFKLNCCHQQSIDHFISITRVVIKHVHNISVTSIIINIIMISLTNSSLLWISLASDQTSDNFNSHCFSKTMAKWCCEHSSFYQIGINVPQITKKSWSTVCFFSSLNS